MCIRDSVASVPLAALRERYNIPPVSAWERERLVRHGGLLEEPGPPAAAGA